MSDGCKFSAFKFCTFVKTPPVKCDGSAGDKEFCPFWKVPQPQTTV